MLYWLMLYGSCRSTSQSLAQTQKDSIDHLYERGKAVLMKRGIVEVFAKAS